MFEDTLGKFVLVIALFAVFVVLGNVFAASRYAASQRASSLRRHGRRSRRRALPDDPRIRDETGEEPGEDASIAGEIESEDEDGEDTPSLLRRLIPQLALSVVALAVAALALVLMWRASSGG